MHTFDEHYWEERYSSRDAVWSGRPNPQLTAETGGLRPGTALDAGCGEGGDALWLAAQGWQVTAVDFAAAALRRGAAQAETLGADTAGRIDWVQADLTTWEPPKGTFDLVSTHFLHPPAADRGQIFARLADAVAPGGSLLIVGHHPWDMHTTMHRVAVPELFFTAEDIVPTLDPAQWTIVTAEARPRTAVDPEGQTITIKDAVVRAQRRP